MRSVLAANVRRLMEHHFAGDRNQPKSLAKKAGITLSSVQRALSAENAATLDTIESLALAFDLSVYQLLAPEIDPANPATIKGATEAERRLYANWRNARLNESTGSAEAVRQE